MIIFDDRRQRCYLFTSCWIDQCCQSFSARGLLITDVALEGGALSANRLFLVINFTKAIFFVILVTEDFWEIKFIKIHIEMLLRELFERASRTTIWSPPTDCEAQA